MEVIIAEVGSVEEGAKATDGFFLPLQKTVSSVSHPNASLDLSRLPTYCLSKWEALANKYSNDNNGPHPQIIGSQSPPGCYIT